MLLNLINMLLNLISNMLLNLINMSLNLIIDTVFEFNSIL